MFQLYFDSIACKQTVETLSNAVTSTLFAIKVMHGLYKLIVILSS